jgi:RNA polymerase sigma-70 factor (sigma-E family)
MRDSAVAIEKPADIEEFALAYGDALMRTAYLLTGDRHRAEDLVQSALLRLLQADLGAIRDPLPYVRRTVINLFMNEQRRLPRARTVLHLLHNNEAAEAFDTNVVEREAVRAALARLKPRQRAAIVLRYYDDLNDAEMSSLLGCSESTVRSTLTRARAKLREQLAGELIEPQGDR